MQKKKKKGSGAVSFACPPHSGVTSVRVTAEEQGVLCSLIHAVENHLFRARNVLGGEVTSSEESRTARFLGRERSQLRPRPRGRGG